MWLGCVYAHQHSVACVSAAFVRTVASLQVVCAMVLCYLFRLTNVPRRAFSDEDLLLSMPSGTTVCDIQVLTVWCQPFNAFFAQVTVDKNQVFVS